MKKLAKLSLIHSFVILGICLTFSPAAQATPKFQGTLSMTFSGMTMIMGMDGTLGNSSMVMLMMGGETVTHSDGDFAVLRVKKGGAVTGPEMMMEGMPMGETLSISSVPGWMWMGVGPATFSSTGPDNLQITITGMTMGGGYAPTDATLTLDFWYDENGMLENSLTLTAGSNGRAGQD